MEYRIPGSALSRTSYLGNLISVTTRSLLLQQYSFFGYLNRICFEVKSFTACIAAITETVSVSVNGQNYIASNIDVTICHHASCMWTFPGKGKPGTLVPGKADLLSLISATATLFSLKMISASPSATCARKGAFLISRCMIS